MKKIVITLAIIVLVLLSSVMTYSIFSFFSYEDQIANFEAELEQMIAAQGEQEFETEDFFAEFDLASGVYSFNREGIVNPFASLLDAREIARLSVDGAVIDEENGEIEQEDVFSELNVTGTLVNKRGKLAIIELVDTVESLIVREGEDVLGLEVYSIASDQIVFLKAGEYFIYSFGGVND